MKIRLKCSGFDAAWAFGQDEVESKAEPATLQALLQELAQKKSGERWVLQSSK